VHAAVALVALVAITVVGVDLGHLVFTSTEVQTVADLAATAGAKGVLEGRSARGDAEIVAGQNSIDGSGSADNLSSVEEGTFASGIFTPGGASPNAVRATARATVRNVLAGIFGSPTSTITKSAIAAYTSTGSGQPTLPLAIGNCNFADPSCLGTACLPAFTQVPAPTNNTAWTGFTSAGASAIQSFLPSPCGSDAVAPTLVAGDPTQGVGVIDLSGGQTNLLQKVECLFENGIAEYGRTEFIVPVVGNCDGNFNGWYPVVGFATIVIDSIQATGNPKGITLHSIFNASAPGVPGGGNFGYGSVKLVG